jgi:hypothetical protein
MGTARKPKGVSRTTKNHNAASGRQPGGWPPSLHYLSHDDARLLQLGLFSIALRVMEGKRYDYSGDEDPYRNFRFSTGVGVEPSTTPQLKLGACPHPLKQAGLQGRLTAAHRPEGRYSGGECCVRR